ncbi:MAG TPA: DinB family protein [Gemmatimonadaceae bacterium]|nr:DinB family protein [Gemmatimonadaceae bacterium]
MSLLLHALLVLFSIAPPSTPSTPNPTSDALRKVATRHGAAIVAAAKLMPPEKYSFRPTPAQRSFAELVVHIVGDARITCSAIAGTKVEPHDTVAATDPKERLVATLQTSIERCDSAMARVTDATLGDTVTYYDEPGLRVQALVGISDDWADHYAQQAIYLRLNGILPPTAKPSASSTATTSDARSVTRDGQRDFDFEIGTWAIRMKRLAHPLSGSSEWLSPDGYSHIVRKVWNGQASLAELENDRPSAHFDGLMLRTYNPQSHEWNIYWGSSRTGALDSPLVGHFTNGRGEFFQHDTYQGKPILVRVVYSDITPTSFHTEQAYSADDGKTWETNLSQTFTRKKA